ncbi:hypothetical protein COT12_02725 [Candidatus Berkelbacteria bacterium CG08_land_8_20_14_0_20_39_8]|uniref:PPM-type phosphatase domain-containing protein n=1 Tax=Candidatus Berkelbacteria bacterium CG08_land_8_20_14_0_20_39_8 TaxID=1974511 RepID=A0A2M6YBR2_9BACT|nr:MAG: hypothetical protein COT12_02725 [Candidatus Berkelbacteria bacterium CG08_land_8_20_14_0_20_39_8]
MSDINLVARIGQIATKGKHKEKFLFVGAEEPNQSLDRFFYIIEIESPWVNGEKIRQTIVEVLETKLKGADKAESFESTIKKINAELGELSQSGEHEWIGKLNAIIGFISNNELIFSQTGRISGYLFRGNKISHITEKPAEDEDIHPLKTFVSIIDGNITKGDKIIIANSEFYSHLSLDRLRQFFAAFPFDSAIDEIVKTLRHSKIKDVNLISFDLVDKDDPNSENLEPKIVILDDIPDSPLKRYSKTIFRGLSAGAKTTGRGVKTIGKFWMNSIQPKISSGSKKVGQRIKKTSDKTFRPVGERLGSVPKVNYFNRKSSRDNYFFYTFSNLTIWGKSLLKPKNRKYLYIIILVILLSIGFIKIQINSRNNQSLSSTSNNLASLDSAREQYSKALDDLGLKKQNAKEELISARDEAQKAISTPAVAEEAKNLLNQIQAKLDLLNSATRIAENTDPTFSFSESQKQLYAVGANLFSISADGKISEYDTRAKTAESYSQISSGMGQVIDIFYNDNNNSLLILTDKPTVAKLDIESKSISELPIADGASWEKSVATATYSSNIYLLDSENGQIWKHILFSSNYTKGSAYLSKQPISIKDSIDLAVDGNIYVMKADGTVIKISRSIEDSNFAISGIPTPDTKISDPLNLFTDQSSNSMYIGDKTNNRVLQFAKTGAYQKQYVLDNMTLTSFAVNEKLKKIWLISDSKVFELDI